MCVKEWGGGGSSVEPKQARLFVMILNEEGRAMRVHLGSVP